MILCITWFSSSSHGTPNWLFTNTGIWFEGEIYISTPRFLLKSASTLHTNFCSSTVIFLPLADPNLPWFSNHSPSISSTSHTPISPLHIDESPRTTSPSNYHEYQLEKAHVQLGMCTYRRDFELRWAQYACITNSQSLTDFHRIFITASSYTRSDLICIHQCSLWWASIRAVQTQALIWTSICPSNDILF